MFSGAFRAVSGDAFAAGGRKPHRQDGKGGKSGKGKGKGGGERGGKGKKGREKGGFGKGKGGKGKVGKGSRADPPVPVTATDDAAPKKTRRQRLKERALAAKARKKANKIKRQEQKAREEAQAAGAGNEGTTKTKPPKRKRLREAAQATAKPGKRLSKGKMKEMRALEKAKQMEAAEERAANAILGRAAKRLQGSRFRWLNETLYSTTGAEAKELFEEDPSLAQAYHEGFRAQRAKWPRNPLDDVIRWLNTFRNGTVVGDFGCGEARIAKELGQRLTVHSFDIAALNEHVVPCNLAQVPLPPKSLDVVVFCLALMGTDWPSFLKEAHRCLKPRGLCHIVEVESRFTDVKAVIESIESIGFREVSQDSDTFFVELRFVRVSPGYKDSGGGGGKRRRTAAESAALLQGCTYKRR